jgi:hypothetical protein
MNQQHISSIFVITQTSNHQDVAFDYLVDKKIITTFVKDQANLHWYNKENEGLGIDIVREIISLSSYATYKNEDQYYILLHFDLASIEAQNALLKVLEEPPNKTNLILTAENPNKLLPTILSRCNLIRIMVKETIDTSIDQEFLNFISAPQKYNYAQAIELAEGIKTKDEALLIISSLLTKVNSMSSLEKKHLLMQNLLNTHRLIEQNVNIKLALENCFFNILKKQSSCL